MNIDKREPALNEGKGSRAGYGNHISSSIRAPRFGDVKVDTQFYRSDGRYH